LLTVVKVRDGMGAQKPAKSTQPSPVNGDADNVMQGLRAIRELDVDLGLSRTTNNPAFYASMLRKFVAAQEDATARVQQAMAGGDMATAERIAHTLKGVAGNLGASDLQGSAAQLEAALREGAAVHVVTKAVDHTAIALQLLVQQLKATPGLLPVAGALQLAELTEQERADARLVVDEIKQLLQTDDASALDVWESHAMALRALYPQAEKIEAAIAGFDFEEALQLLA
jgi:HPt (histidine-containing phosphotransfer) domain-containing protein